MRHQRDIGTGLNDRRTGCTPTIHTSTIAISTTSTITATSTSTATAPTPSTYSWPRADLLHVAGRPLLAQPCFTARHLERHLETAERVDQPARVRLLARPRSAVGVSTRPPRAQRPPARHLVDELDVDALMVAMLTER